MLEIGSVYKWQSPGYNFIKLPYSTGMQYMENGTVVTVLDCYEMPVGKSRLSLEWSVKLLINEKIISVCGNRKDLAGFLKIC